MKKLALLSLALAFAASVALMSCRAPKPSSVGRIEKIELTDASQVDRLLNLLEGNVYQLPMLTHDVCANGDAIIAIHEQSENIIKQIEGNPQLLTPEQQERFSALREEYRNETGF